MTQSDMKQVLRVSTGENDEVVLSAYLDRAASKIVARAFPFGSGDEKVPARYEYLQVEIAEYMLNKRGAEGETSHSENGISRSYENGSVPESMLSEIIPFCGVVTA